MKNLTDLLGRFVKSLNKDEIARQAVADACLNVARVTLAPGDISLKEGVLTIAAGAAAKNELKLKEEKFLASLREIYNIRVSRVIYI